jgi:hypothetical protein
MPDFLITEPNVSEPMKTSMRKPSKLAFLPEKFRAIVGVQHVTTPRQLQRLDEYMRIPEAVREPFVRLGCSVRHGSRKRATVTSSTYAVTIDDRIEVVFMDRIDPRSAFKQMLNDRRPWNISAAYKSNSVTEVVSASNSTAKVYVVRSDETEGQVFDGKAYNVSVICRRDCVEGEAKGFAEYLITGSHDWWVDADPSLPFAVREATYEIFSGRDGCFVVNNGKLVQFPERSFADYALTALNGHFLSNVTEFLEKQAREYVVTRSAPFAAHAGDKTRIMRIRASAALRLRKLDLTKVTHAELDLVAVEIKKVFDRSKRELAR